MITARPVERPLEQMARAIVAHHLDTLVERSDDGTAPGQPDGLIYLPDGGHAPLEVVSDHDVAHAKLSDALDRQGDTITTSPGEPGWYIALRHGGNLKSIRLRVPEILHELPAAEFIAGVVPADTWAAGPDHADRLDELSELGVSYLAAYPDRPGVIGIGTKGWSSWEDPIDVVSWISRVLGRENDVAAKLQHHGGPERHAFIWSTLGSAWAVNAALNWHPDAPPLLAPIAQKSTTTSGAPSSTPSACPASRPHSLTRSSRRESPTSGSPAPSPEEVLCTGARTAGGSAPAGAHPSTRTTSPPPSGELDGRDSIVRRPLWLEHHQQPAGILVAWRNGTRSVSTRL